MEDCIFCKIANHELDSDILFENDDLIVFADNHPVAPVHHLVIPKKHIKCLNEITEEDTELLGKLQLAIKEAAQRLGVAEDGYRVISNCGENGGQVIDHLHYHIIGGIKLGSKIVRE